MDGAGAVAVLVCVYGNRAYDNAFVHPEDIAKKTGFRMIGAVAAIAKHSIARCYATGRPDENDKKTLSAFAEKILRNIERGDMTSPVLPGVRPYTVKKSAGPVPEPANACTNCGICAANCPSAPSTDQTARR